MMRQRCDAQLEASVLGEWASNPQFRKAWTPEPGIFYASGPRALAQACADLQSRDPSPEQVLLELRRRGQLDLFEGGASGAESILTDSSACVNPWQAIQTLRDMADGNALENALKRLAARFQGGELTLDEMLSETAEFLRSARSGGGQEVLTIADTMAGVLRSLSGVDGAEPEQRFRTGFYDLDRLIGGLRRSSVYLLGARTNWGKSFLMQAIMEAVRSSGGVPLYISLEDSADTFGARILSRRSKVNSLNIRDNQLSRDELALAIEASKRADESKELGFLNARGKDVEWIVAELNCIIAAEGVNCVFVDYMQKLRSRRSHGTRELELAYCNEMLSDLVKNANAVGVFSTQFTDVKPGERPDPDKVKHCRAMVDSCEVAVFGYTPQTDVDLLYVAKGKYGGEGNHTEIHRCKKTGGFFDAGYQTDEDIGFSYDEM